MASEGEELDFTQPGLIHWNQYGRIHAELKEEKQKEEWGLEIRWRRTKGVENVFIYSFI